MSVVVDVAEAVAAQLNAAQFDPPVQAQRASVPVFDLAEIGAELMVSVVPRAMTVESASRSCSRFEIDIDIGVQRRVNPDDPGEVDALHQLVEDIGDALRLKRLDAAPEAQWAGNAHEPLLLSEHLERMHVFTSVLTVSYRVVR